MATATVPDTRERILRTTIELIGREGIGAVTNRRVADAAEVSLGSLTYHFDSQVDLVRESLVLMVGEEVATLEGIAAELRRARPSIEQVATEVERVARESLRRVQELAEIELHLQAARDPELRDASRRCFLAYEEVAEAALEALRIPDADIHARSIVALMYGLAVRRLGTGDEDLTGLGESLLTIARGAQADA